MCIFHWYLVSLTVSWTVWSHQQSYEIGCNCKKTGPNTIMLMTAILLYRHGYLALGWIATTNPDVMMTSSNGNIFRVTGHLCGEFTGHRWIPRTKASGAEIWCFLDLRPNKRLSKQSWGWWFETLLRPLWRHCNVSMWYNWSWILLEMQATNIAMSDHRTPPPTYKLN